MTRFQILTEIFSSSKPSKKIEFKNEDLIGYNLHAELCYLYLSNKIDGIWFHVANEGVFSKENFRPMYGSKLKQMGKAKGIPDYIFLWNGGCAMVELKHGKNKLTDSQKVVKQWAFNAGIPHCVAYSKEEAIKFLKEIKFIKD